MEIEAITQGNNVSTLLLVIAFCTMQEFHEIVSEGFDHKELTAMRQAIVDHYFEGWEDHSHNERFADMWRTGAFDALEVRCEEFLSLTARGSDVR